MLTLKQRYSLYNLKVLDTFGKCQGPVFSLVMHTNHKSVEIGTQLVIEVA